MTTTASPEERRAEMINEIISLIRLLNDAGAVPRWCDQSLDNYVDDKFQIAGGLDGLTFESGRELIEDLGAQLAALRGGGLAEHTFSTPRLVDALGRAARTPREAA